MYRIATALISMTALAAIAHADPTPPPDVDRFSAGEVWIMSQIVERGDRLASRVAVREHMARQFGTLDIDGDGFLTAGDHELKMAMQTARNRASEFGNMLAYDLDGDGIVTREEVTRVVRASTAQSAMIDPRPRRPSAEEREAMVVAQVEEIMKADRNGDGRISSDEARAAIQEKGADRRASIGSPDPTRQLLTLDGDGDGRLSSAEFDAAVNRVFTALDGDGDGTVSAEEKSAVATRLRERERRRQEAEALQREQDRQKAALAACGLPAATDEDVVLYGTYHGAALSDTAVGPRDIRFSVGRITIEPGASPLYLILTSYDPMIWQFDGAVDRLHRVVVAPTIGGPEPLGATVGVNPKVVVYPTRTDCLGGYYVGNEARGVLVARRVEWATGKQTSAIGSQYMTTHLAVPSMSQSKKPAYFGAVRPEGTPASRGVWREFLEHSPGGLVRFDPAKLDASRPAHRHAVLPEAAGLAQLIEEGFLEPVVGHLGGGGMPHDFRIVGKMTFPEGLHGAHSVRFILKRGVPMPDGDPGHSCVVPEDPSVPTRGHC